jgi:tetratricopeptide (TPR) repeat protein
VRAIGNDLHMDYSAVGETTHLAARMEQMATPGTIRLPAATLRLAEGVDRRYDRVVVPLRVGQLHLRQGNVSRAIPLLERALVLSQGADMELAVSQASAALAVAYAWAGHGADIASLLEHTPRRTDTVLLYGEAHLLTGCVADASQLARRALAHARAHQEQGYQARALWLLGEVAVRCEPLKSDQAGNHYHQALAVAEELGMRPLVAHCHLGFGRLCARLSQWEQVRAELSAAIMMYRSMEMTFWLPQAEAALAQAEKR